jgi:hypothetical protein
LSYSLTHPRLSRERLRRLLLSSLVLAAFSLLASPPPTAATTFNYLPAPVDVSPAVANAWTDVNVSAYVPAGATGVIIQWVNVTSGADQNYGVRMNGSSDNWAFDSEAKDGQQGWLMTGLDGGRVFEVFTEDTAVKTYLVGYTMAGVKFFANRIDKSTATTGSWVDVSIAADTGADTAIGAIFHVDCQAGSSVGYGLRKKGSTDNRLQTLRANMMNLGLVGVDAAETAQQQIAATTVDLFLVGYVTSGAVFFTNALDKSTATTGSYQDVDLTIDVGAGVANGAFVEIQPSDGTRRLTAVRPKGASYDYYAEVSHQFALVGLDAGDVFEQKIEQTTMDLFLTGYSLADGAGAFRVKSGRYTGTGGALSITGLGFQPDVVIVDGVGGGADAAIKTSTMGGANSKQLDNGAAFDAVHITSLDPDGFSVGADVDVNQNGITYYWVAMKAAPGAMKVGTYAGSAGAQNVGGVGFTPDYVIVMSPNASDMPMQRSSPMPANFCLDFAAAGYNNSILNMQPNGFGLGTHDVAGAGITFHYVAWARTPGRIAVGSYVGNKANNRDITGVGFLPDYVLVDRSSDVGGATGTGVGNAPVHKMAASGTAIDSAPLFNGNVAEADNIQALLPDGFQLGTHCRVNGDGTCNAPVPVNYYWVAFGPHQPQVLYRSVGTTETSLASGAANALTISGSTASFGSALANNIGVGDVIHYDSDGNSSIDALAFVHGRTSAQSYTVKDKNGATPTAVVGDNNWAIHRAYTSLANWESQTENDNITEPVEDDVNPPLNLMAADASLFVACYADGADATAVTISGWTTGPASSIGIFTPYSSGQVGASQRHTGVWDATKYRLVASVAFGPVLRISEEYVRVAGLQIENTAAKTGQEPAGIVSDHGSASSDVRVSHNILRATGAGTANASGAAAIRQATIGAGSVLQAWNNIMYGWGVGFSGEYIAAGGYTAYNNTIIVGPGEYAGFEIQADNAGATLALANNLVQGTGTSGNYSLLGGSTPDYSSTNLSQDPTAPAAAGGGGAALPGRTVTFVGAADYHLSLADTAAKDAGTNLASGPLLAVVDDVDAQVRQSPWDVGADDVSGTTAVTLASFGAEPGDSSVLLSWRTASELENLGFHVYRALQADGPWTRLTSRLIPGLGSSALGQAYSFRDTGLANGTRYFYRLEDVDAASRATSHGPVSAVPLPGAVSPETAVGGGSGGAKKGAASSCPDWVVRAWAASTGAEADTASLACTRHGDPEATSFGVVTRDLRSATVELRTLGFYALRDAAAGVRIYVPGFDFAPDERALALPFRRALVEAVVGRRVQLGGMRALEQQGFSGLAPAALGAAEMQVGRDGTVRAARGAARRAEPRALGRSFRADARSELVRLLPSQFQGETKSALLELRPLRYDPRRDELVLARRLRVRLLFTGREADEHGHGSRGRAAREEKPASGEVLARLHTTAAGLHAVSFEQLLPGRARALEASELRLEREGEPVAFHLEPFGDRFGPGGRLFFFADRVAASTDFSAEVAYELVRSREGLRMPLVAAAPGRDAPARPPVVRRTFEQNRFYQPGLLEATDLWQWEGMASGWTRAKSFALGGLVPSGPAELEVELQGASESGRAVDHHVNVAVNGVVVGEAQFAGKKPYRVSLSFDAALLREGDNELALTNVADTGVSSYVFLDRFTIAHPQTSSLAGGRWNGRWPESGSVGLQAGSAVSGPVRIVDVTALGDGTNGSGRTGTGSGAGDVDNGLGGAGTGSTNGSGGDGTGGTAGLTAWLAGFETDLNGSVRFRVEAGHRYWVGSDSALFSPRVSQPQPSTLKSAVGDYLLIAPRAFLAAAEPLLSRRKDQGLTPRAVAFEDVAAEFGHGRPSAEAICAFLRHAFHSWSPPSPRYVLLLGDSSYDPRNFTGSAKPAPLPALFAKTSYMWTASDPRLAAVNGDDELPDLAIGRLPATSVAEAETLVSKLVAWEDAGHGLGGPAAFVADNPDLAGDFEADIEDVRASFFADRETRLLRLRELGAATRPAIKDALDGGLSYLGYVGHGGAAVWASENVWSSRDAQGLQAQSQQPLLVTMNCLNGYFVAPAFDSLAESLLKAEGRGSIAAVSPSGLSLDGPAHQYHRALMEELTSGRHERLGDALAAAQAAYARSGLMPELISVYHLLGDPALPIR